MCNAVKVTSQHIGEQNAVPDVGVRVDQTCCFKKLTV
jgi:hypothetical protein